MRRTLAGTGRVLITLGLLILLFVGYQLWGTNVLQARAQSQLEDEFAELQAGYPSSSATAPEPTTSTTDGPVEEPDLDPALETGDDPTLTESTDPVEIDLSGLPPLAPGDPLGRIQIPEAGVDEFFVVGVGREELKKGPGHYPGTPLPGSPGLAAIAGHRTTYGAPFFDLNQVRVRDDPESDRPDRRGDVIVTETLAGAHVFEVVATRIVEPNETWVAGPIDQAINTDVAQQRHNWSEVFSAQHQVWNPVTPSAEVPQLEADGSYLVLTTCNPRYSAAERLVVLGELITDEHDGEQGQAAVEVALPGGSDVEVIADLPALRGAESFEEGLGGDTSSIPPAILWALFTFAVGMLWWWLYRRWRHPGTLITPAIPFLVVLVGFYIYLERLLPSGY